MENSNKLPKSRQELVDTVLASMKQGKLPWKDDWAKTAQFPVNASTGKPYNGINMFSLYFTQIKTKKVESRWATFNQIQENKWSLNAGAKGAAIEVYKIIDKRNNKEIDFAAIATEIKNLNAKEKAQWQRENLKAFLRVYHVFNGDDIKGLPKLKLDAMPREEAIKQTCKIEEIIRLSPAQTFYDGGSKAFYNPGSDSIHLPRVENFFTKEGYYGTALHEIAHSTGHKSRLNRDLDGGFGSEKYSIEELRAEFSSVFLQRELGGSVGSSINNSTAYIQAWQEGIKKNPEMLFEAIKDASAISDYVKAYAAPKAKHQKADVME